MPAHPDQTPKQAVAAIATLTMPNWDTYGAEPITEKVVAMANAVVDVLKVDPWIAPGGDGSIGFEWSVPSGPYERFMFDVKPDGTCEAYLAPRREAQ